MPRAERQPAPEAGVAASDQRLRSVRIQHGAGREVPLQRLRRGGDRPRDGRLSGRRRLLARHRISARPVRPARRLGRRLREADRPRGRRAHPQLETADLPVRPLRGGDGPRKALLHQRRRVAREESGTPHRERGGRSEARPRFRGFPQFSRRGAEALLRAVRAGDERRRPARGGALLPQRGPRPARDGAPHSGHLLERPLPPHHLHHRAGGDHGRGVVRKVGDRGVAGPLSERAARAGARREEHLPDGPRHHRRPLSEEARPAGRSGGERGEQRLLRIRRRGCRRTDREVAAAVQERNP